MTSAPAANRFLAISGARPNPCEAFSAFTIARSICKARRRFGNSAATVSRPFRPTMSPRKSIRMKSPGWRPLPGATGLGGGGTGQTGPRPSLVVAGAGAGWLADLGPWEGRRADLPQCHGRPLGPGLWPAQRHAPAGHPRLCRDQHRQAWMAGPSPTAYTDLGIDPRR